MSDTFWIPKTRENVAPRIMKIVQTFLERFPQLPLSVRRIITMAGEDDIDPKKLADVASADPVLVSRILVMVNSSYYGLNRRIDNIRLAIVLLGFNEVFKIAIKSGFARMLGNAGSDGMYDTKQLWVHSYLVSVFAETFADENDPQLGGVLATIGVLHDIGKFALNAVGAMMRVAGNEPPINEDTPEGCPLLEREELLYGINHNVFGALLAEHWGLSQRLVASIEYHHHPSFFGVGDLSEEWAEDIMAVCLSDLMVNHLTEVDHGLPLPHSGSFGILGLEPPLEGIITDDYRRRYRESLDFANSLV